MWLTISVIEYNHDLHGQFKSVQVYDSEQFSPQEEVQIRVDYIPRKVGRS